MPRRKLVAGNWKMHGSLAANEVLLLALRQAATALRAECAVCVPFPYLAQTAQLLSGSALSWGGQNLSEHAHGAYTGEVAGAMLREFGCKYVIVGHSERRALYGEDDATVARKFSAAQGEGLVPIVCVGETLAEREQGVTQQVVARQLDAVLAQAGVAALRSAVVAYEPVWAIGTGKTATPEDANAVHRFLRQRVATHDAGIAQDLRILYGGSVKGANAAKLMAQSDIDGGLVGGASLVAEEFISICQAV